MLRYLRSAMLVIAICCLMCERAEALAVVQITNISDFSIPSWSLGDPAPSAHIDMCIYAINTQIPSGYNVTVTGSNGFNLISGAHQLPYSVYWDDSGAGSLGSVSGTQLSSGSTLTAQTGANILSITCALGLSGPNARLDFKIAQADITAALAGTYTGSVTILISPN